MMFKAGQLYANSDPSGNGWCKHGLVQIVEEQPGRLRAIDTYWSTYTPDGYSENPEDIKRYLTLIIDTTECRAASRDEFEIYADRDRALIPMGGSSEKIFVRNGAAPDPERHRQWLRYKIGDAESNIKYAIQRLADLRKQLAKAEAR